MFANRAGAIIVGLLLSLLLSLPQSGVAAQQSGRSFDLPALIKLGLEENLGLQVARIDVRRSDEALLSEQAAFDPSLFAALAASGSRSPYASAYTPESELDERDYSARVGLLQPLRNGASASLSLDSAWNDSSDSSSDLNPSWRSALVLELNQPLLRGYGTELNQIATDQARLQQRQAQLQQLLSAQQLVLNLELSSRQLASLAQQIDLRQQAVELAKELWRANRVRFDAGLIAVTELQEAETALANRRLLLSQTEQNYDLLRQQLNQQLNFQLPTSFQPRTLYRTAEATVSEPASSLPQLVSQALEQRLELKIMQQSLDSSELERTARENGLKPQLDLNFQLGLNGLAGDDLQQQAGSAYAGSWSDSFSSLAAGDGYQWQTSVQYRVALGRRAAKARLNSASLAVRQNRYRLQELQAQIKSEVEQQQTRLARSYEQLQLAEQFARLAQTSLEQEQRRLEEGLSDTFRMTRFQQSMIEARIGQVAALNRWHQAQAQLAFACGQIFSRHHLTLTDASQETNVDDLH